jgi:hypothetical protein
MKFFVAATAAVAVALGAPGPALAITCAYQSGTVQPGWTPTTALTMTNQSIYHTNSNNANASYTAYRIRSDGTIAWQKDYPVGTLFSPLNSIDVLRKSRMWYHGSASTYYYIQQDAKDGC